MAAPPALERELLLATANPKKRHEMERILADLPVHLHTLEEYAGLAVPAEEGATFRENARAKAVYYSLATGRPCIADDSGLAVAALEGAPGVRSARYAGEAATDARNRRRLLDALAGVPPDRRQARFHCAVALARGATLLFEAEGTVEGVILEQERGSGGFGYDALFYSPELGKTFAEAPAREKDQVSHRGRALALLAAFLRNQVFSK